MKNKKLIILLITITLSILIIQFLPVKSFFYETLIKTHIIKRCYEKNYDFNEIFNQENLDYALEDKKVTTASLEKLLNTNPDVQNHFKIPLITHHIYFTSSSNPIKLNDFYIEKMKLNFSKLNLEAKSWKHYIWTNNPHIIPEQLLNIHGVEIKQIADIKKHALYNELEEITNKGDSNKAYFAEAADLLRLIAIEIFGGIYNDMDYEIYNAKALTNLMTKFDFIGGREMSTIKSFYGNSFIAAKPEHPILIESLKLNFRNHQKENAPEYIKYPCKESTRIYFNGPPLITIAYFLKNNINDNIDIILPSWMIFNADFAHFKNKTCDYKNISKTIFINNDLKLSKLLEEHRFSIQTEDNENEYIQNIYYNNKYNKDFPIIGADMFCGNWIIGNQFKRNYYWFWRGKK